MSVNPVIGNNNLLCHFPYPIFSKAVDSSEVRSSEGEEEEEGEEGEESSSLL
jgi:hypothetical protein